MTTGIEAEIQAEAKKIEAWYGNPYECPLASSTKLTHESIQSLANHLVRNRIQVEDAQVKALVKAARDAEDWIVATSNVKFPRNLDTLKNIRAALLPFKEMKP